MKRRNKWILIVGIVVLTVPMLTVAAVYSPATEIQAFDPATLEIRARILTNLTREAIFVLSEDGQSVSLKSLRVIN